MNIIRKEELYHFSLEDLKNYSFVIYFYTSLGEGEAGEILKENKFNKYLLDNNLFVREEHLEEVIDELEVQYEE